MKWKKKRGNLPLDISEKLAIAYGLMKMKDGEAIWIVKNLPMCEDCHSAIKFISVVTEREIIVRYQLRFHHFKDGSYSWNAW